VWVPRLTVKNTVDLVSTFVDDFATLFVKRNSDPILDSTAEASENAVFEGATNPIFYYRLPWKQGYQMVYFLTKNPNLG
jgi:hypothetical protein